VRPHEKKMKKAEALGRKVKQELSPKMQKADTLKYARAPQFRQEKQSEAEIKKMQIAQAKALEKLAKGVEALLLGMNPKKAFETVALIKDAGIFDLFVALGKSSKLLKHLKKGKK